MLAERDDGGLQIDVAHRHVRHPGMAADARAEFRHHQRVGPEVVEEMVLGRDRLDLQHLGQRARQHALALVPGGDHFTAGGAAGALGLRQLTMISLVADRHRDERQLLQIGRHHVGRQPAAQRLRDIAARQPRRAVLEGIVGRELHLPGLGLEGGDGGLRHLRHVEQHLLDLDQLDAVAADLHLGVDAPVIFDLAVVVDAAEIAGAVDPARGVVRDRQEVGDELAAGQVVAVHVAGGEPDAGDADLAQYAPGGDLVDGRVEDHDRVGRQRRADRHRLVRDQLGQGGGDGRLGRPVGVQDRAAGTVPADHQIVRAGLAPDQQDAQPGQLGLDGGEQRRAAGEAGDLLRLQKVGELVTEQLQPGRARHQCRARHQRHPDLLDREVESDGHALIDAVARPEAVARGGDAHEIADAGVLDDDALGIARRSRGVDDVAAPIGRSADLAGRERRAGPGVDCGLGGVEQHLLGVERREPPAEVRHRHDDLDAGVRQDEADPVVREAQVERHVGGVDLHHRQHGHVGLDALVEQQADALARDDALREQVAGDLVGAPVEVTVAHDRRLGDDRVAVAETNGGLREQMVEPLAFLPARRVAPREDLAPLEARQRERQARDAAGVGQGVGQRAAGAARVPEFAEIDSVGHGSLWALNSPARSQGAIAFLVTVDRASRARSDASRGAPSEHLLAATM